MSSTYLNQIKCCDPYNIYNSTAKPKVQISLDLCHETETIRLYVIPGQKLSKCCHEKIKDKIEARDAADTSQDEFNALLARLAVCQNL